MNQNALSGEVIWERMVAASTKREVPFDVICRAALTHLSLFIVTAIGKAETKKRGAVEFLSLIMERFFEEARHDSDTRSGSELLKYFLDMTEGSGEKLEAKVSQNDMQVLGLTGAFIIHFVSEHPELKIFGGLGNLKKLFLCLWDGFLAKRPEGVRSLQQLAMMEALDKMPADAPPKTGTEVN
jgi:hypothetical protein